MNRIVGQVRGYWRSRLDGEDMAALSEAIRQLRVLLQETLSGAFLALPLPKAREFRFALNDELFNACNEFKDQCAMEDHHHHSYCVKEIIACFEWAEQIKEEIPEDVLTQRILAVDIPILRPFDYGVKRPRPVKKR
ncbi:MAG: hypothetical protein HY609_00930 [Deltaproteobacteria bacterium]|nr:hypothetical protein [Deltaproteobacteria bacterium]MBI4223472.1 hypothetical protein [Deltaproteobacteria bacterium]